ncbi:MAG: redoxin domain-containing protein [Acidimicrobiia bacterium]|nr:redoxin domain-containing protein [Acidimicrobiia bacterium]
MMSYRWPIAVGLALSLVACGGDATSTTLVAQTAAVTVTGTPLAEYGQPDGSIGKVPPTLSGVSFEGDPVSIDPADGAHVILFVAHWCSHCQNEIPVVVDWLEAGGLPADVQLTVVSTAVAPGQPNYPPSDWLSAENVTVPILLDDEANNAAAAYGLKSFPYLVAIGASGQVAVRAAGELPAAALDALVSNLGDS